MEKQDFNQYSLQGSGNHYWVDHKDVILSYFYNAQHDVSSAAIFKNSVDFKRNAHMFFKDQLYYTKTNSNHVDYGFSIIFSKTTTAFDTSKKNYNLCIAGVKGILAFAFRYNVDRIDIYNCIDSGCNINSPAISKSYTFQKYSGGDFHVMYIYKDRQVKVYAGDYNSPENLLLTYNVNLAYYFDNGVGYLGFSTAMHWCYKERYLVGSFLCTKGTNILPTVKVTYNGQEIPQDNSANPITAQLGETMTILVTYVDSNDATVMGAGTLTLERSVFGSFSSITLKNDREYIATFYIGNLASYDEVVKLTYSSFYDTFSYYFKLPPKEVSQLQYYGQTIDKNDNCIYETSSYYLLQYGRLKAQYITCNVDSSKSGNYEIVEFSGGKPLEFIVIAKDMYGNGNTITGSKPSDYKAVTNLVLQSPDSSQNITIDYIQTDSNHISYYKISVGVSLKGTFTIGSTMLSKQIKFYVKMLTPDTIQSTCTIIDKKSIYKDNEEVKFKCEYVNSDGDKINTQEAITELGISFLSKISRKNDNNIYEYFADGTLVKNDDYYTEYKFTSKYYHGQYSFTGYYKDGQNLHQISTSSNFIVIPEPKELNKMDVYDYKTKTFIPYDSLNTYKFYYDNNDYLFALNLKEIYNDGTKDIITDFAKIKEADGYSSFNINNMIGTLRETDSEFESNVIFSLQSIGGNEKYIQGKVTDSKIKFRRTSYEYEFEIKYKSSTNKLYFKVELNNIGSYKACRLNILPSNSYLDFNKYTFSFDAGKNLIPGKIILITKHSNHLYNYFLEDSNSNITFNINPNNQKLNIKCTANNDIYGTYDLDLSSTTADTYLVHPLINNQNLNNQYYQNEFTVVVNPLQECYKLIINEDIDPEEYINADQNYKFSFKAYDKYDNLIYYPLTSSDMENNLGLNYKLEVDGIDYTQTVKKDNLLKFIKENNDKFYYIQDSFKLMGNYSLTIGTKYNTSKITYYYHKHPGKASNLKSIVTVLNKNKINYGAIARVKVELYDSYDNNICLDSKALEKEFDLTKVIIQKDNNKTQLEPSKEVTSFISFSSTELNDIGLFTFYGLTDNIQIQTCISCSLEVIDSGFNLQSSQLSLLLETKERIMVNGYYTLYYQLERPSFVYEFYTLGHKRSTEVYGSKDLDLELAIQNTKEPEESKINLNKNWINENTIIFTLPNNINLEYNNDYKIMTQASNDATYSYVYHFHIQNYNENHINQNIDYTKTTLQPGMLELTAGEWSILIVSFKDENGYDYLNKIDSSNFTLTGPDGFNYNIREESNNGQLIIDVMCTKYYFWETKGISFINGDNEIKIDLVVNPNKLNYFSYNNINSFKVGQNYIIYLTPKDEYDNTIIDSIFDTELYHENLYITYFNVIHSENKYVNLKTMPDKANKQIKLIINTEYIGQLTIKSKYLKNEIEINIQPEIPSQKSYGYVKCDYSKKIYAGTTLDFVIEPRDKYGNKVKSDFSSYNIKVYNEKGEEINSSISEDIEDDNKLLYKIQLKVKGINIIKAFYNNEEIVLSDNNFNVLSIDNDDNATYKLYYFEKESNTNTINIEKSSLPLINIQFYDSYGNQIQDPSYYNKSLLFTWKDNNIKIEQEIYNSYIRLNIHLDSVDNYFKLNNGEYEIICSSNIIFNINNIKLNIQGEGSIKDTNIPYKFTVDDNNLNIIAGQQGTITLTFKDNNDKNIGNFFNENEINNLLTFTCGDTNINGYFIHGKNYGQYYLLITSNIATKSKEACTINYDQGTSQQIVYISINSENVNKCNIVDNNDKIIDKLNNAYTDEKYEIRILCYDKFDNKAELETNEFQYKISKENTLSDIDIKINKNNDNSLKLSFYPNIIGTYTIISPLIDKEHSFISNAITISEKNSFLKVTENSIVGNELDLEIIPYDLYGNKIQYTNTIDYGELFNIYYRYKNNENILSNYQKVLSNFDYKNESNYLVLHTKININIAGNIEFISVYKESQNILNCINCISYLSPDTNINITNTKILYYNTLKKQFDELIENKIIYNHDQSLLLYLYIKDNYGNNITINNDTIIQIDLNENKLNQINDNKDFLIFYIDNNINDGILNIQNSNNQKLKLNVKFILNKFNTQTDNTVNNINILVSLKEFNANNYGYFMTELVNKDGIRIKCQTCSEISINTDNKIYYNTYSPTVLVTATTNTSNTFPIKKSDEKIITCNNINKSVYIYVHPRELNLAKVYEIYLKNQKELIDSTADLPVIFDVIGKDIYDNNCPISDSILKLNIYNNKDKYSYELNNFVIDNSTQRYKYKLTKVGIYSITTETDTGSIFENDYTIEIIPGEISLDMTTISILEPSIIAGNKTSLSVNAKDQYNNQIILNNNTNKFKIEILSSDNIIHKVENIEYDNYEIYYSINLQIKGDYNWKIYLNNEEINCYGCVTTVNPDICYPLYTIIYTREPDNQYYDNINIAYSHINKPLSLKLTFKDKFNNTLNSIDETIQIENSELHGNNMKKPLSWTPIIGSGAIQYDIDLNLRDDIKKHKFEHLVERLDTSPYYFYFTVHETILNLKQYFQINVAHHTNKDDTLYGNGDYYFDTSNITENKIRWKVGQERQITLYLKTNQSLLYNDDIDFEKDFDCNELFKNKEKYVDKSFKCSISKPGSDYGIYIITYYTELVRTDYENHQNLIKLRDITKEDNTDNLNEFRYVQLINTFEKPDPSRTVIETYFNGNKSFIEGTSNGEIKFIVYDIFGNPYRDVNEPGFFIFNDRVNYTNNNIMINNLQKFEHNYDTYYSYEAYLYPTYPPKEINIRALFNNTETYLNDEIFIEPQKGEYILSIDYSKTVIITSNGEKMASGDLLDYNVYLFGSSSCLKEYLESEVQLRLKVQGPIESQIESRYYDFNLTSPKDECVCLSIIINDKNKYTDTGHYWLTLKNSKNEEIVFTQYYQLVYSSNIDKNKFVSYYAKEEMETPFDSTNIKAGTLIPFYIKAYDSYGNEITESRIDNFIIEFYDESGELINNTFYELKEIPSGNGLLKFEFKTNKSNIYNLKYIYLNEQVYPNVQEGPSQLIYVPGKCGHTYPKLIFPMDEDADEYNVTNLNTKFVYTAKCYDDFGSEINIGGEKFTSSVEVQNLETGIITTIETNVIDNNDGTYDIEFIPPILGQYFVTTYLDGYRYDNITIFNITQFQCSSDEISCPNNLTLCVKNILECIPKENRCDDINKPFKCSNGECVKSNNECPAPTGYKKCEYMNAIVPDVSGDEEDLCPYFVKINCNKKYPKYSIYCPDGICRKELTQQPNQRVCPIGYYLCPDLTCKDSIDKCFNLKEYNYNYKLCDDDQIKCSDQSCVYDQKDCPTLITCQNENDVVCPDGTCVSNEVYCKKPNSCSSDSPYLCTDGSCSINPQSCSHYISCGHGKSLCSDLICREDCH